MADVTGDPAKRYYVRNRGRSPSGGTILVMVEGVPDPDKPDDPGRDGRDGPVIVEGDTGATPHAWTVFNLAGFHWTEHSFKRFWVWSPAMAERVRSGEAVGQGRGGKSSGADTAEQPGVAAS